MKQFKAELTLVIAGPFLVGDTAVNTYGLDLSFHRDWQDRLVIPSSQIKGLLRSSLAVIKQCGALSALNIETLFGQASGEEAGDYLPRRGRLDFSDIACLTDTPLQTDLQYRVAIDEASGVAAHRKLRTVEQPFGSGQEIKCTGSIFLWSDDIETAKETIGYLLCGLRWITALGGQRGIGYGRLMSAEIGLPQQLNMTQTATGCENTYYIAITAEEPILVGGVKLPKSNFVTSELELPGGLIKGALAAGLNRAHGRAPHMNLDKAAAPSFPGYEALVEHFDKVHINHGFPCLQGEPRPTRLPLSTVEFGKDVRDTALSLQESPMMDGQAPAYEPDWKEQTAYFGTAFPPLITMTRTGIDASSRRVAEGQLFTELAMAPTTSNGCTITWLSDVHVEAADGLPQQEILAQLAQALQSNLHHLGKRNRHVTVTVLSGKAPTAIPSFESVKDGVTLITLQSDAIMIDPDMVRDLGVDQDLRQLYRSYWEEISNGCLEMDDVWAKQVFAGGYLYHRYLGADEDPKHYRPYYLTQAGSTFRLRVLPGQKAQLILASWAESGLPLPAWAMTAYSKPDRYLWQTCPFVPENGYGEIAINLKWHWEKRIDIPGAIGEANTEKRSLP